MTVILKDVSILGCTLLCIVVLFFRYSDVIVMIIIYALSFTYLTKINCYKDPLSRSSDRASPRVIVLFINGN
jgi:hypothetical protein